MRDNRLRKPTFPDTTIGDLLKQADTLKYQKIYNYNYTYYVKTLHGMRDDIESNHKYGNTREGYESWQNDNSRCTMSYSGVTTVRTITENNEITGYMFEEKLPNSPWLEKMDVLLEEAWKSFCSELEIVDEESMQYFLFNDTFSDYRDDGADRITKFNILLNCIEKYNDINELDYKQLINKIKG